ncbi:MAG: hypothetical protein QM619_16125 [Micropruina sp.]|uniref:hypothetical protein n=1 Tax=Micropruina sp. TaxID=2737536 RepID=UPI0039E5275A
MPHGHRPGSPDEVVLLGWSGGAQIALGATWYRQALGLHVSVLSLGGMLSDDWPWAGWNICDTCTAAR